MNGSESGLSKLLWKWVGGLSELFLTVSELAVLVEWALSLFLPVLAHLGLELLFQGVELALCSVEVVIIAGLLQMSHNLAWRVVEIPFFSIWAQFALLKLKLDVFAFDVFS